MSQPEKGDQARLDWTAQWQPLVDRIGERLDDDDIRFGPDAVEAGMVRRYLEPLEFDCALHDDRQAAQEAGYPDVIAPYTAVWSMLLPLVWAPGDGPTFDDSSRNAQPRRSPTSDDVFPGAPATSSSFGASISLDFDRPLRVGERVGAGPRRLVACVPKQTRVGRGAFVTFSREVFADNGDRVAVIEAQIYLYNPFADVERVEETADD